MADDTRKLRTLKVFYSEDMVSDSYVRSSPSDRKPRAVAEALVRTGWPVEMIAPEPTSVGDVCKVHDPTFVDDVLWLRRPNGFGSYAESVARAVLYMCGACHDSALVALTEGISASLTSGFHHAGPRSGRGFCTFNGLMITAVSLLEAARVRRLVVLDGDYHYGDGTQAIIDTLGLGDRVLHISLGRTFRRADQAGDYLAAIAGLRTTFESFAPDLIIYQAGADVHVDDPLGGVLTTEQMRRRDQTVFATARELAIPVTWNLAGGYQIEPDGTFPRVVQLHLNTFEEALQAWRL